jgi:DNA polymerase-3 subunit epsilon/exodeoxyribonuclease X
MAIWTDVPLVALDLEGSGAQDRDDEAILEIAVVPLADGKPSLADAYTTLINPGRTIPRRPWISPGLAGKVLTAAPTLSVVIPELAARINGKIVVGHNTGVDCRLLRRRCPDVRPQAVIDTLRLARHVNPGAKGNSLGDLLDRYSLTVGVSSLVPDGQPHRALWDTVGTALLLGALISDLGAVPTLAEILRIAGLASGTPDAERKQRAEAEQGSLFDP